jgi:hypothetical protein
MRNTMTQDERRWDSFFGFNKALFSTGWRMDAYSLRTSRSYAAFNGNANIDAQVRVGQSENDGHAVLSSVGWSGSWSDVGGGLNGEATVRSDGSVWMGFDSSILSKLGVDFLNNVKLRTELIDDGSKSGGVQMGWSGSHGDINH